MAIPLIPAAIAGGSKLLAALRGAKILGTAVNAAKGLGTAANAAKYAVGVPGATKQLALNLGGNAAKTVASEGGKGVARMAGMPSVALANS